MRGTFRYIGWIVMGTALSIAAVAYLRAPNGLPATVDKMHQVQRMEDENSRLRQEIQQRQDRIDRLKSDAAYRDRIVRERLNVQKRNEKTYYITPDQQPAPAAPAAK